MTVLDVRKDPEQLTMTITCLFTAPPEQVWTCWSDPRRLERWWGPPGYPATFVDHDLRPDGRVSYYMTSPEGEKYHGWWRVTAVDAPHRLEFEDGFADSDGAPDPKMPTTLAVVTLTATTDGTRMEITSRFPSAAAMEQLVTMGMEEGITQALGQIDDILRAA